MSRHLIILSIEFLRRIEFCSPALSVPRGEGVLNQSFHCLLERLGEGTEGGHICNGDAISFLESARRCFPPSNMNILIQRIARQQPPTLHFRLLLLHVPPCTLRAQAVDLFK